MNDTKLADGCDILLQIALDEGERLSTRIWAAHELLQPNTQDVYIDNAIEVILNVASGDENIEERIYACDTLLLFEELKDSDKSKVMKVLSEIALDDNQMSDYRIRAASSLREHSREKTDE